jgi:hypothetical protein
MISRYKTTHILYLLFLTLTIGILIGYYFGQFIPKSSIKLTNLNQLYSEKRHLQLSSHINLIDLNLKTFDNFSCIKSKILFELFQTTICLHDINKDIYVSGTIINQKIWEENLVKKILRVLLKNPDYGKIKQLKKIDF